MLTNMSLRKIFMFIVQAALVGVMAAVIMIFLLPGDWLQSRNQVVTVHTGETQLPVVSNGDGVNTNSTGVGPYSYAAAVSRAVPAVVNIFTKKVNAPANSEDGLNAQQFRNTPLLGQFDPSVENLGSGVIVSEQGHILTSHHVIQNAEEIKVSLHDGRNLPANVIGADPETDLAVLQIQNLQLPSITLGDSSLLSPGDVVLAIGNPFGVGQTVTQGIVSAIGRDRLGVNVFENYIQTDAAINPGNSGGALINARGELIGINTLISSNTGGASGIGFAIPIHLAQEVMIQLIENGHVVRGWIGVQIQNISPQLSESFGLGELGGVLVSGVARDGPAHVAGLYPGDIITSINGRTVSEEKQVLNEVISYFPKDKLTIRGIRKGKEAEWKVVVEERPIYGSLTY
jgi:serine protease DegS